jgi:bifunctional ADP-heptose synthase (sugar kinase/adenylyltransferase)
MLSDQDLELILERIPQLTIGVLGDLFLDRYLDIDAALTEPSLETGLDAYQVVRVRSYPGAAGTVINNLVALGVKKVRAISVIGDDGEGHELLRALERLHVVDRSGVLQDGTRRTPTYTKPMLQRAGQPAKELNRLDIKNRAPLSAFAEESILTSLNQAWKKIDALIVSDQVSEADCGVITTRVRNRLAELGNGEPEKVILADSRERIGLFRSVWLKPNLRECVQALEENSAPSPRAPAIARAHAHSGQGQRHGQGQENVDDAAHYVRALAERAGRPVFCTQGEHGVLIVDPRSKSQRTLEVPAYPVAGPVDIVGAGDSANAAITCALAAGADLEHAAAFGCLVASITIQQIGTTGTASPDQVRKRWQEVRRA